MKTATKRLDFTITKVSKKDASNECMIEGYANTSTKDRVGDVVLPSAFEKCLPTYLKNPVLLMNHDWNDPAGVTKHAEITDKGLFIRARVSDTREDVKTLIREGCLRTFSIGYNELDADMDESTQTKIVKELELLEISIVSVPANTEAMFTAITAKDTEEGNEKNDGKNLRTVGALKTYLAMVKDAVGKNLGDDGVLAVIEYFNESKEEELMNKEQLLAALRAKSAPTNQPNDAAKADGAAAGQSADQGADAPQGDDAMKALMAKLDALAEAVAQMFEKINAMSSEEASEEDQEKPADEGKADDKPKDEEDDMKDDDKEKGKDQEADEDKDKEEEKEMSVAEIDQTLAEVDAQLEVLEDAGQA